MTHPDSWCPDGYNHLSPYLIVEKADGLLAFVRQVFDAEFLRRFEDEKGGVVHAEARIGDTVIMVADSVEAWPPVPPHLHLYVPDVDATFARALEAGAEALQEPTRREGDADRRGGFRDASGTTWWVATQLEEDQG
jgi:PhnB protein